MKIAGKLPGKVRGLSPFGLGIVFIVVLGVVGTILFSKNSLQTALSSGETIKINFAGNHGLVDDLSPVKVAWVRVGTVSDIERQDDGRALISVKVDEGTADKIGSEPSAMIRPTTLLGGNYFVDLVPGGDRGPGTFSGTIPVERTGMPVELDEVTAALQPNVLKGVQGTVKKFDQTLGPDGQDALSELLEDAPSALQPTDELLTALQGTRPRTDLTDVVSGLESTARAMTAEQGRLDTIVTGLKRTTGVLSNRSGQLSAALTTMPQTLRTTRSGLARLDTTLGKLRDTAEPARPIVTELESAIRHLDPVLVKSRPVVGNLTSLLADARPLVQQLNPLAVTGTLVLDDMRGAPLQRVNGPVKNFVLSPFKGRNEFKAAHSDKPLYQELAYMIAGLDRATGMVDRNGHALNITPGANAQSVVTGNITAMLEQLTEQYLSRKGGGR